MCMVMISFLVGKAHIFSPDPNLPFLSQNAAEIHKSGEKFYVVSLQLASKMAFTPFPLRMKPY